MTDTTVDLSGARVFAHCEITSAERWYLMPDDRVWYRQVSGELVRSILTAADVQGSYWLEEVTQ